MNTLDAVKVVILRPDRLYGDLIRRQILDGWPNADVRVFRSGMDALTSIQAATPNLFITDLNIDDMDGLEHLEHFTDTTLPILIVTSGLDARTVQMLREVRYDGIYDGLSEGLDHLHHAIRLVMQHEAYVSPTFRQCLKEKRSLSVDELTETEEMVLALIGDGSDNTRASDRLGLRPKTVSAHREAIMRKLDLHHKGELMIYAMQQGFVRITPVGVSHPGFQRKIMRKAKLLVTASGGDNGSQKKGP